MFTQTSISNLSLCDGNGGTPNMLNKFLRGANTSANAGSTGGTSNHIHDASHSHSSGASHTHTGTSGGVSSSQYRRNNQSGNPQASYSHNHAYTTGAGTASITAYSSNTPGDALIYPPYSTLKPYINISGG